jgi:hypothetical protein
VRRSVDDLEAVSNDATIVRLVHPLHYAPALPEGRRLLPAAFSSKDATPSATSYGASAYHLERLPAGLRSLEATNARWSSFGVIAVPAAVLDELRVRSLYSPEDCDYPALRDAHVSLVGIDRTNRDSVLERLERHVIRLPVSS